MRMTPLLTGLATLALTGTILSAPAMAHDAKVEKTVSLQAAAVWTAMGSFCGIQDWHPAVAKCAMTSDKKGHAIRTLSLKGGGEIVERESSRNPEGMSYSYTIVSGPLPVRGYSSTLSVTPTKDRSGAVISWVGNFKPAKGSTKEQAVAAIMGVYQSGVDSLAAYAQQVAERTVR